jgi:hypothetical protein
MLNLFSAPADSPRRTASRLCRNNDKILKRVQDDKKAIYAQTLLRPRYLFVDHSNDIV